MSAQSFFNEINEHLEHAKHAKRKLVRNAWNDSRTCGGHRHLALVCLVCHYCDLCMGSVWMVRASASSVIKPLLIVKTVANDFYICYPISIINLLSIHYTFQAKEKESEM